MALEERIAIMARNKKFVIIVLLHVLYMCFSVCSPVCNAQEIKNQSQFHAFFRVKQGKLVVDRNKSTFTPSETFTTRLMSSRNRAEAETANIKRILVDDLNRVLAKNAQLYWYALLGEEQNLDAQGKMTDELTKRVRTHAGDWARFTELFAEWANASQNRDQLGPTFATFFTSPSSAFTTNLDNTALIFFAQNDETGQVNYDAETGTATFQVADPVRHWSDKQDYRICFPLEISDHCPAGELDPEAESVRQVLQSLPNRLWRPGMIRASIEDYYIGKGFLPTVRLSAANEEPKWINIQKSMRLGRILLPNSTLHEKTRAKILYLLLPDQEFRFYVRHKDRQENPLIQQQPVSIRSTKPDQPDQVMTITYLDYLSLGENRKVGDEPLLNQFQLQTQQLQLAQLGFIVTQVPSGGREERIGKAYLDLQVLKMSPSDSAAGEKPETAPQQAAPLATQQGVIDARPQKLELQTEPVPATPFVPSGPESLLRQPDALVASDPTDPICANVSVSVRYSVPLAP
jgi:hypothetical protein